VDDRVLAGISETHESKEGKGRREEIIDAGDGVSLKKHREGGNGKPHLYFPKLLMMANIKKRGGIGSLDLPQGRELKD